MSRRAYRLPFGLAGIPLYVDVTFLMVFPLMVWGAMQYLSMVAPDPAALRGGLGLGLGVVSALGLFACVVAHELGHSLTARRYGVRVRRITLWFLGGIAEFDEMPKQRGAEAVVGIAGPLVSFALAGLFWGVAATVPHAAQSVWLVAAYLTTVNLMLGLFNLLPALPMDGGRILRSLLALRMPHGRATRIAGNVARVVAVGFGILGVLNFNLWLILLAFFIVSSVKAELGQALAAERVAGPADDVRPWTITQADLDRAAYVRQMGFRVVMPPATPVTVRRVPPAAQSQSGGYSPTPPVGYTRREQWSSES